MYQYLVYCKSQISFLHLNNISPSMEKGINIYFLSIRSGVTTATSKVCFRSVNLTGHYSIPVSKTLFFHFRHREKCEKTKNTKCGSRQHPTNFKTTMDKPSRSPDTSTSTILPTARSFQHQTTKSSWDKIPPGTKCTNAIQPQVPSA